MTDLLIAIAAIFIIAAPFLLVANEFDLPTVPFFILAGIVAGLFIDEDILLELARWGIALLVFGFGARIRPETVRTVLDDGEIAAVGQVLILGVLGFGSGLVLGLAPEQSLFIGATAAFSSTIVGTALFREDIRKNLVRGRLSESIHFVQDLLAIVVVLVVGAQTLSPDPIATQLGYGVVLVVAGIAVYRYLFSPLQQFVSGSDELMIVGVIALLILFLGAAELAGVSIVVGAFAAGLAVRANPNEFLGLTSGLESIRDFFVAIFFVTVGALVALPTPEVLLIATVLGVLTAVIKPIVTTALLLWRGYEPRSATLTSLNLDQVSEFALIIAIEGLFLNLIIQDVFDAIILAAAATMITSSLTRRYDDQLYHFLARRILPEARHERVDSRSSVPEDITDHIIIVGYGRQGRQLAETCSRLDHPYIVVENDPTVLESIEAECEAYVFSDATEPYTWEKANLKSATLVVSTVTSEPLSNRLVTLIDETELLLQAATPETALERLHGNVRYVAVTDMLAGEQLAAYVESVLTGEITPDELRTQQVAQLDVGENDPARS